MEAGEFEKSCLEFMQRPVLGGGGGMGARGVKQDEQRKSEMQSCHDHDCSFK